MKNKIGIVTVYGENNYGNKLQNYACIKIYENYNFPTNTIKKIQSSMKDTSKSKLKKNIKKFLSLLPKYKYFKYENDRKNNFINFSKKYLNLDPDYSKENLNNYTYLSVGSDQVWNDIDFKLEDLKHFLLTDIKNPKKIALAPSIGKDNVKEENEKIFIDSLRKFEKLSCREITGTNYIKKLTKCDCITLPDPTMSLSKEEWEKIEKKPKWLMEKKYIFSYFLGGMSTDIKEKYSSNPNIELIDIMDKKSISYTTSPEEFLYLIHHSEMVLTDSFHACVFSIIFNKDFRVFERVIQNCKMTSRIETLFNLFEQEVKYEELIKPSKWKNKNVILEKEINKVKTFLNEILTKEK